MCIIITKPSGVKSPKWDCITQSCNANPDGFSVSWFKTGMAEPEVKRTLNKKEFLDYFKSIYDDTDTSWVLHARIKSAGSVKLENCHCWRDESTGLVFCHNGTLSIRASGDMTDSETFFRNLYIPAIRGGGDGNAVVEAIIGASKFAFMKPNGEIITYGKYVEDPEYPGVKFSNGSYKIITRPATTTYYGGGYGAYGAWGGYSDYCDDDYGDYDYDGTVTPKTKAAQYKKSDAKVNHSFLIAHHGWHFFKPNSSRKSSSAATTVNTTPPAGTSDTKK